MPVPIARCRPRGPQGELGDGQLPEVSRTVPLMPDAAWMRSRPLPSTVGGTVWEGHPFCRVEGRRKELTHVL